MKKYFAKHSRQEMPQLDDLQKELKRERYSCAEYRKEPAGFIDT